MTLNIIDGFSVDGGILTKLNLSGKDKLLAFYKFYGEKQEVTIQLEKCFESILILCINDARSKCSGMYLKCIQK